MTLPKNASREARANAHRATKRYNAKCRRYANEAKLRKQENEGAEIYPIKEAKLRECGWVIKSPELIDKSYWHAERPAEPDDFVEMEIHPRFARKLALHVLSREAAIDEVYAEMYAQAATKADLRKRKELNAKRAQAEGEVLREYLAICAVVWGVQRRYGVGA